jgi:hypothetical protein
VAVVTMSIQAAVLLLAEFGSLLKSANRDAERLQRLFRHRRQQSWTRDHSPSPNCSCVVVSPTRIRRASPQSPQGHFRDCRHCEPSPRCYEDQLSDRQSLLRRFSRSQLMPVQGQSGISGTNTHQTQIRSYWRFCQRALSTGRVDFDSSATEVLRRRRRFSIFQRRIRRQLERELGIRILSLRRHTACRTAGQVDLFQSK